MAPVTEQGLTAIRTAMRGLRAATAYDKVINDECAFSFDTPFSEGGLYVSLVSYQAFSTSHVALDRERTGNTLYVRLKWTKVPKEKAPTEQEKAPTKMAIGGEGGFQVNEEAFDIIKENAVVCFQGEVTPDSPIALGSEVDPRDIMTGATP
jgi:ubiquitin carboxyl-terminal hydrolase 5/13